MQLKETIHSYYCEDSQYNSEYDSFEEFKEDWCNDEGLIYDLDYNFLVRYDIQKIKKYDSDDNEIITDDYGIKLFFIHQRKGHLVSVNIKTITKEDMTQIHAMLKDAWCYLKELWKEV